MKKILIGLLLILVGCTVGPNYQIPTLQLPTNYIEIQNAKQPVTTKVDEFWWHSIGDPILVQLLNQALTHDNLDIQKAKANVRQARATLGITKADYYPELDLGGKISRDRLSRNAEIISAFPGNIPLLFTDYAANFDASWEIDVFGYTRRSAEAARARWQYAIATEKDVAITTAAEVIRLYTLYRVYQKRIEIAEHNIASYNKTAKLIKLQQQAGIANLSDIHLAQSDVHTAEAFLKQLQPEALATLASLAVMVGEPPETLYPLIKDPKPIPTIYPKYLTVGVPSDLLRRRPDIRAAERNLAAATADVGVATANLYPRFQLIGSLGFDTTIPGTYLNNASRLWSLAPHISTPIFQGGKLRYAVKSSEAARDYALANYKQTVLQALADVESAMIRYEKERQRKQKLLAARNNLQSASHIIEIQFINGSATLVDKLIIERQRNQIADLYVQSVGQETINIVSLYKALGGDWLTACFFACLMHFQVVYSC
jgi:NodT family efflux transporter outer membrane factor (OMF) lipoprotein